MTVRVREVGKICLSFTLCLCLEINIETNDFEAVLIHTHSVGEPITFGCIDGLGYCRELAISHQQRKGARYQLGDSMGS